MTINEQYGISEKPNRKINPFDERKVKNSIRSHNNTEESVRAVAEDTNKTRRKNTLLPLSNEIKKKSIKSLLNKTTK